MEKKRVLLGMSGGVDSSVAAFILQQKGFEVVGVTLKLWDQSECTDNNKMCCSVNDVEDAKSVAAKLGITHYVLNFKEVFKRTVVDYFVDEYLRGRTPNPCIACNRYIKFSEMIKKADVLDCEYVSTGHYARIEFDCDSKMYLLKRGVDAKKDQSYVLYNLTQESMARVLLPLSDYTKSEIRAIATQIGIRVANKPDSQEICFVDEDYAKFIREYRDLELVPGKILNVNGDVVGNHEGILNYTVGQRKGIAVFDMGKVYVTNVDCDSNSVTIGKNEDLFSKSFYIEDYNFVSTNKIENGTKVQVKIRYSAPLCDAKVFRHDENTMYVEFDEPQRAITPGQSAVIYVGEIVLLGGIIKKINNISK